MSYKSIGLSLGPLLFLAVLVLPPFDSFTPIARDLLGEQQPPTDVLQVVFSMKVVFALLLLMVLWWLTEAIPLPATALLPAVVLPWFHAVGVKEGALAGLTFKEILTSYANPVIYLFLGGFLLAAAMQKWNLDKRIIYWLLARGRMASDARMLLLGIMGLTAFISMWISNTATTAMMLPLGVGIISQMGSKPGQSRFGTAMMLGIAWAASIGGVGTVIGTPPNGIALGILESTLGGTPGYEGITFLDWMKFGVPYVVVLVPVSWFILLRLFPPEQRTIVGGPEAVRLLRPALGKLSSGEKATVAVFLLAVVCWLSNPFWDALLPFSLGHRLSGVDEFSIGLFAGVILFFVPVNFSRAEFVLDWGDTKSVDWGTLVLFGGGIALSEAMFRTGVASWMADTVISVLGSPSPFLLISVLMLLIGLLSEIASNTAVATMMVPVVIAVAQTMGSNPVTMAVAAALASSIGFMLPVATPPNAMVFATRRIRLRDMMKAGFILDIVVWLVTVAIVWFLGATMFGD